MAGVVIIGAGECGTRAALARRGRRREGTATLIGAAPDAPHEHPQLSRPEGNAALRKDIATEAAHTVAIDEKADAAFSAAPEAGA
ncbi:hypothetical protein C2I36_05925 [Rhodobacteraceae bacterium WD3A24]|nr:hypothetical protein C2I36_05925 [Rhodobacteraceae bacterium WD3A24]